MRVYNIIHLSLQILEDVKIHLGSHSICHLISPKETQARIGSIEGQQVQSSSSQHTPNERDY